jgi:serine/threonine-protein kinase
MKCPQCNTNNPADSKYCKECATSLTGALDSQPSVTKTLETPVEALIRGTLFADRYEIIEKLGAGGMGKVYRVEDKKAKEEIALKVIKPEIAADRKVIERFRNELTIARKIRHKHVCGMYDLGEDNGTFYITMEYVQGEDLKSFIKRSKHLSIPSAVSIARQVCEGLSEAHDMGIVHRDLKPSNIMIDKEGNARIMDFGIARSVQARGITGAGVIVGTPEYMSPEQVEGKEVNTNSDLYSLGVILYEMVTGQLPFEGDSPLSIAHKHRYETPRAPIIINSQIPSDLNRVIMRCLDKDEEARFQSASEIHSELGTVEKGIPAPEKIEPKRKTITSKEITVSFRIKNLIIPAVVLLGAAAVIFVLIKSQGFDLDPNRVAVAPFENLTGDESWDNFGNIISDSIHQGIAEVSRELKRTDITSRKSSPRSGSQIEETAGKSQMNEIARKERAGIVITGYYHLEGDSIHLQAEIVDMMNDGEQLYPIAPERGSKDNAHQVISTLRQRILGVLATNYDPDIWGRLLTTPPTFEAYKEYKTGLGLFRHPWDQCVQHFQRAAQIDPTYVHPRLHLFLALDKLGEYEKADQIIHQLQKDRDRLTPYEKLYLRRMESTYIRGDHDATLRILGQLLELTPTDEMTIYQIGSYALYTNRPQETVAAYAKVDPKLMYRRRDWYIPILAKAHHLLGNYEQELAEVHRAQEYSPEGIYLKREEIRALSALGRTDEVKKGFEESLTMSLAGGVNPGIIFMEAAKELRAHGHKEEAQDAVHRAVNWYETHSNESDYRYEHAQALYVSEQWDKSEVLFRALGSDEPENVNYMGYLGLLAARRGDNDEAFKISNELRHLNKPRLFGINKYFCARIASILGEHQQAIDLFRDAITEGHPSHSEHAINLHREMDFEPLRDYPEFQSFLQPKQE